VHALLALVSNVIGGSSYPAATVVLRGFPARDAATLRMGAASLCFLPALWAARGRLARLDRTGWALCAAVGVLGYTLPLMLGVYGQSLSTATSASLLIGMEPVTIILLSALLLGEALTGRKLAAMALGLAGAAFIAFQGPPRLGQALSLREKGDLVLALHGACWGLYTVLGKPALKRMAPLDFTALTTLIGFLGCAAWSALRGASPAAWAAAPLSAWLGLAYLAVVVSFAGAWLWNLALEGLDASAQANYIFLQPLVGVLIGVCALGDPFTRWTACGGALILGGVWAAHRA
jgi:drug/metabolite transporter (DMT)-like permease